MVDFAYACVAEHLLEPATVIPRIDLATKPGSHADHLAKVFTRWLFRSTNPAQPGVLLALHSMITTAWLIARRGFTATYLRYADLPRGDSTGNLDRSLAMFLRAENFFVASRAPDDCLARSLSLYHFLNRVNVRAEHVIGVCRFPFRAHAWVETDGRVVLQGSVQDYTPIARL